MINRFTFEYGIIVIYSLDMKLCKVSLKVSCWYASAISHFLQKKNKSKFWQMEVGAMIVFGYSDKNIKKN